MDLDANAFAITLVLLRADVEERAMEIMAHVFDAMPGKVRCQNNSLRSFGGNEVILWKSSM